MRRKLSDADIIKIIDLYCNNKISIHDISKSYKVSHKTISKYLKSNNILIGKDKKTILHGTDDFISKVVTLYNSNISVNKICKELNCSYKVIHKILHKMNLNRENILKKQKSENTRVCAICGIEKLLTEFHNNKRDSQGKHYNCKECQCDKQVNTKLLQNYNITSKDYIDMLEKQNGVCAICGNSETIIDPRSGKLKRLAVDHDHITEKKEVFSVLDVILC